MTIKCYKPNRTIITGEGTCVDKQQVIQTYKKKEVQKTKDGQMEGKKKEDDEQSINQLIILLGKENCVPDSYGWLASSILTLIWGNCTTTTTVDGCKEGGWGGQIPRNRGTPTPTPTSIASAHHATIPMKQLKDFRDSDARHLQLTALR